MRAGVVLLQAEVWLMLAVLLSGCAGQAARKTALPQPTETEAQWQPATAHPDYPALARDLIRQGHYAVALRQLDLAARADESAAEPHYLRGVCQREIGDPAAARKSFQRAIRLDREYAPAYNGLGMMGFMERRYPEARKALKKAVALNPANPDYINNLGVLEMRTHRTPSALARFEQCLRIAPAYTKAKNNLAECLVRLGRNDAALAFLQHHFPPAVACNNLGAIYERIGYPSQARGMFLRALVHDPGLAVARRNLNRLETQENSQP